MDNPFDDAEISPEVLYLSNMINDAWLSAVQTLVTDEVLQQKIMALAGFNMLAEASNDAREFLTSPPTGGSLDSLDAEAIAKLFEDDAKKED